jgi:transcriptional regulator with XRE-family HTH domain
MRGGQILREARRRAALTQSALAARLGVSQPVVARWEADRGSITVENLARAVEACGFALDFRLRPVDAGDAHDWSLVATNLRMTPQQRLTHATAAANLVLSGRAALAARTHDE